MTDKMVFIEQLEDLIDSFPPDSILSRTIYQDDSLKTILFGFQPGQELSEHTASVPAILQFIKGEAQVILNAARGTRLPAGCLLLDEDRLEPLARPVHRGSETRRPATDDHHVVKGPDGVNLEADLLGDRHVLRVAQRGAVGEEEECVGRVRVGIGGYGGCSGGCQAAAFVIGLGVEPALQCDVCGLQPVRLGDPYSLSTHLNGGGPVRLGRPVDSEQADQHGQDDHPANVLPSLSIVCHHGFRFPTGRCGCLTTDPARMFVTPRTPSSPIGFG